MRTLPKDFFFGAAFSGPQTEGAYKLDGKLENIWDTWSDERIGDFYNQVGSYVGNDFYHRYESDIQMLKSLGLTSFRTSIQWSRLLDQDGKINPEGAAFYHKLLACAKENGMEVFINLYHFDMPTYLFRRGGWESREVVEAYAHYAEQAFTEFAGEVKYWFTFNEPIVEPEQRYREGFWYPFVQDIGRSIAAQYHIALAHSLATAAFRRLQKSGVIPADVKIGLINCFARPIHVRILLLPIWRQCAWKMDCTTACGWIWWPKDTCRRMCWIRWLKRVRPRRSVRETVKFSGRAS